MNDPGVSKPAPRQPLSSESSQPNGQTTTTTKLLLVDDNAVNLSILAKYVTKLGCEYATASNGQEAVDLFRDSHGQGEPFNYVLMDISMPVMDGFTATRAIRAFEKQDANTSSSGNNTTARQRPVPVIALTGLGSESAQREGDVSGIDVFLTKPVKLSSVRTLVEEGIGALAAQVGKQR